MSNALALAAVTAVLKDLLDNTLIDQSVSGAVGGAVTVSALPPDRIETGDNELPRLNLFLYQVLPSAALRNIDLPSRNGRGQRVANAPLALDLYYLLSAYSAQDFQAEILLGYAMQLLHERPVLTRDAIRATLAAPSPVDGGILPPAVGALAASDLAEQVELVKLTPVALNTEEISKLWTAFQAKYRPSIAYVASVVLIQREDPALAALPVLSRGPVDPVTHKDRGVVVQPSLLPPYPALVGLTPPAHPQAVRMGELLELSGRNLGGDTVAALFKHVRDGDQLELSAEPGANANGFQVRMPPDPPAGPVTPGSPLDPASWRAGVYAVAAVIRNAGEPDVVTNELPVALAPTLTSIAAAPGGGGTVIVTTDVTPPVRGTQSARLLVGTIEVAPDALVADPASTLTFTSPSLPSGAQWVRLRVDEVESVLIDRTVTPPVFDPTQRVTVP
jgi:hypothetical protein